MGCIISIIVTLVSVTCPTPPPADAAQVLAQAPGLSNRTNVYTPSREDVRPRVVLVSAPHPAAAPTHTPREQARSNRMGIPGGWTPLEWAILHGGPR